MPSGKDMSNVDVDLEHRLPITIRRNVFASGASHAGYRCAFESGVAMTPSQIVFEDQEAVKQSMHRFASHFVLSIS